MAGEPSSATGSITSSWLAEKTTEPSAAGIAATVGQLIRTGAIAPGARLPAVRELAGHLQISPATVSAAWSQLRRRNVIAGKGRQGSWVSFQPLRSGPQRFSDIETLWSATTKNLIHAVPDPDLLPDLRPALAAAVEDANLNSYYRQPITESLRSALDPDWPTSQDELLVTSGGYEGLRLLLSSSVMPGEQVAVADPSTARLLDILEHVGARPVAVETDHEGPTVESLRKALRRKPAAFIYEPRSSSHFGVSLSTGRRDALAAELDESGVLTIEDDGVGDIAVAPYAGVGELRPDKTVLVRSYAKTHGPDLRIAVIGGHVSSIKRANDALQFGSGWTSRVLQNALAYLLRDPVAQDAVRNARTVYSQRREQLVELLAAKDVNVISHDGLSISVPVQSEQQALLVLASHGIAALGAGSGIMESGVQAVRIPVGAPFESPERIAEIYALAAKAG